MRPFLCVSLVCLFATTAAAQFGKNASLRATGKPAETTQRKTTDKGHPEHPAKAADQAVSDADLAAALLSAMDADGDGVVTKIEMNKAMAALRKVHKDSKGNMAVPEKAADAGAAVAGGDPAQGGAGAVGPGGGRVNESVGRIMQYDRNRDGRLTPAELPPELVQMLRDADTNRDGAIDAAELNAFAARMGDRMRAMGVGADPKTAAGVPGVPGDGRGRKPPQ